MEESEKRGSVPLSYRGEGWTLFGMFFANILLSIVTLGVYSFWGKARILRYVYSEASIAGSTLAFHGTGREFFKAFLKFLGIVAALALVAFLVIVGVAFAARARAVPSAVAVATTVIILAIYAFYAVLIPIAINSRLRYRMSRTSWRGLRLGYAGLNKEFVPLYLKGLLLSILTLGIYWSWFSVRMRRYTMEKIRFGRLRFAFVGEGKRYFLMNLRGFLLTIVTLGVYGFWWARDVYRFNLGNIVVVQGDRKGRLEVEVTAGRVFRLVALNALLAVITLGLATPWIMIRNNRFVFGILSISGDLDPDSLEPEPGLDQDAIGESVSDFLDLGDFGLV